MATFTYKLQEGVFVTTDIEPEIWMERFPVTVEEENLIIDGAVLEIIDGTLLIIDGDEITEVTQ